MLPFINNEIVPYCCGSLDNIWTFEHTVRDFFASCIKTLFFKAVTARDTF